MNLTERVYEGADWTNAAVVNKVLRRRVPQKADNFFINPAILASQGELRPVCFIDQLDWKPQDGGNLPVTRVPIQYKQKRHLLQDNQSWYGAVITQNCSSCSSTRHARWPCLMSYSAIPPSVFRSHK